MSIELDRRLLHHLLASRLFDQPGLALLAVSGGLDSVALLDLMFCIADELRLDLAVAHIVHGISSEAADAAPHVQMLAHSYRIPFYLEQLQLGPDASETLARQARYEALRAVQHTVAARYLVTAHHFDDQTETVLFRFLRGSGTAGLAGIPARGPHGLVRPLLPFERAELEQWLSLRFPDPSSRPPIFDDPANADTRHDRSWIRHQLLPLLRERFGETFDRRLAQVPRHAGEEKAAWSMVLRTLPDLELVVGADCVEVARTPLQRYDKLLSRAVLRAAAREIGCHLGSRQVELLLDFLKRGSSGRTFQLGSAFEAMLVFDRLRIGRKARRTAPDDIEVEFARDTEGCLSWEGWEFTWSTDVADESRRDTLTAWLTYGPCVIRGLREGDRIRPLGGVGTRKVSRVLMEARIPASERLNYPIISRGDEVIWVPGVCRSEADVPAAGDAAVRLEAHAY